MIHYLYAKLLEVAERTTILKQFGEKTPLPEKSSTTIRFNREEKFTSLPTTALTEGIPPDAVGATINYFEATMAQYGYLVRLSEVAELTARHPIVQRTLYLLGLQAAETYDQIIYTFLVAQSTQIYYVNNRGAVTSLLASDQVSYIDLVNVAALLLDQAARTFEDGAYVLPVAPQVHASLQKDPDWKASNQFKAPEKIWRGEVGTLADFRVVRTNSPAFAYTTQATSGKTNKYYVSFGIGRFAYQIADLQNLKLYVVRPGGHSDPLQQSWLIGWKFMFNGLITNTSWIYTLYSSGANSTNN